MADKADKLLSKERSREALGNVSRATLDRLIARGDLPVVKISERVVRVSENAIETFIAQRTERRGR